MTDIAATYRLGPRAALAEQAARGRRESRALAVLMLGCALGWLAQWPRLQAEALQGPADGPDFTQLAGTAFVTWVILLPLVLYGMAALAHGASRAMGGRGEAWTARLALFWAWLAASPFALATGLAWGLTGPSVVTNLLGILWIAVFAGLWAAGQREAAALGTQA